ncbi:MAG: hypothetical protein AB8B69_24530, partial [Chitinophagales bacterium]
MACIYINSIDFDRVVETLAFLMSENLERIEIVDNTERDNILCSFFNPQNALPNGFAIKNKLKGNWVEVVCKSDSNMKVWASQISTLLSTQIVVVDFGVDGGESCLELYRNGIRIKEITIQNLYYPKFDYENEYNYSNS